MTDSTQTLTPSQTANVPHAPRPPAKPVLTPFVGSQAEYDALPASVRATMLKPDIEGKRNAFKAVRRALYDALQRKDLTPQEHYDLNTPFQALGAHEGPKAERFDKTPETTLQRDQRLESERLAHQADVRGT